MIAGGFESRSALFKTKQRVVYMVSKIVVGFSKNPCKCKKCGSERMTVVAMPQEPHSHTNLCGECGQPLYAIMCADCQSYEIDEGELFEESAVKPD